MILRAGNVEVYYENGFLRYFKVKEVEVLRMIYFTIRDVNWGTYQPTRKGEVITQGENSFSISYEAEYSTNGEVFMAWQVQITGDEAGKIIFEISGSALHDFKTNRAGFCVLHPIEHLTEDRVIITHSDNQSITLTTFPKLIEPYLVFSEVQAMEWHVGTGAFKLQFEGDVFETEDQRNWGDTSFKTYSTPIALPFPRLIEAGSKIQQRVVFEELQTILESLPTEINTNKQPFEVGIAAAAEPFEITSTAMERLKSLTLDHYRVEVDFSTNWHSLFDHQLEVAIQLEIPLDLVFFLDDDYAPALNDFLNHIQDKPLTIKYLTLFSHHALATTSALIDAIEVFRTHFPAAKIGVGTNSNFTELNRDRLVPKTADFVCFAFHPQEHASDDLTLLENTETMKYQVESALAAFQRPVHIAPISLLKRNNPYATELSARVVPYEQQIDPRQQKTFLVGWTNAVWNNLLSSGVQSVTLYQTVGDLGIMDTLGNPYPVYNCFMRD